MDTAEMLITAVDHPSLAGRFDGFLDELRTERRCSGPGSSMSRTPSPAIIDQLTTPRVMRLGVVVAGRLVAVAAVDNDGAVALAVVQEYRRRGVANELMRVVTERAAAIGYPPLHRYTGADARLAG